MIKKIIKSLTPPIFFNLLRRKWLPFGNSMWSGNYSSWDEALNNTTGYDARNILESCKTALLKIKIGDAVYERDSVLFNEPQYSWPLLAGLQKAAIENNNTLNILDFGGSLGSSYFQNKSFLSNLKKIEWNIVEQKKFVECGLNYFQNEELNFFETVDECVQNKGSNSLLLSGVLQYLPMPALWIEKFIKYNFEYIIIDRTSFIESDKHTITIQNVPEEIYKASYPCWFFNEVKLLKLFREKYTIIASFESYADGSRYSEDGKKMYWKGFILKLDR